MRYFFHIRDGQDLPDEEGCELASPEEARLKAVITASALIKDDAASFGADDEWRMDVTDAAGMLIFTLRFAASTAPVADDDPLHVGEDPNADLLRHGQEATHRAGVARAASLRRIDRSKRIIELSKALCTSVAILRRP